MLCENNFCIYWSKNNCILNNIEIDISGVCKSCIYLNIEEEILNNYRKNSLKNIENNCNEFITYINKP